MKFYTVGMKYGEKDIKFRLSFNTPTHDYLQSIRCGCIPSPLTSHQKKDKI